MFSFLLSFSYIGEYQSSICHEQRRLVDTYNRKKRKLQLTSVGLLMHHPNIDRPDNLDCLLSHKSVNFTTDI